MKQHKDDNPPSYLEAVLETSSVGGESTESAPPPYEIVVLDQSNCPSSCPNFKDDENSKDISKIGISYNHDSTIISNKMLYLQQNQPDYNNCTDLEAGNFFKMQNASYDYMKNYSFEYNKQNSTEDRSHPKQLSKLNFEDVTSKQISQYSKKNKSTSFGKEIKQGHVCYCLKLKKSLSLDSSVENGDKNSNHFTETKNSPTSAFKCCSATECECSDFEKSKCIPDNFSLDVRELNDNLTETTENDIKTDVFSNISQNSQNIEKNNSLISSSFYQTIKFKLPIDNEVISFMETFLLKRYKK